MRQKQEIEIVDVRTGELVGRDFRLLDDIAAETRELFLSLDRDEWKIGANLAEARQQLGGDREFGQWCSLNFSGQDRPTLYNYRRRFEVFGNRREEVEKIPKSGQYMLAAPSADSYRENVIEELLVEAEVSFAAVQEAIRKYSRPAVVAQEIAGVNGCTIDDLNGIVADGRKFGTVYADPPWRYGNQGTRASTGNHYVGMTVDEICALPVAELAAEKSHLHLWTTNGFLFDARRVMEAWGFEYRSCFVWVKPQMGIGNYWRVSHEFMLLGVRGGLTFADRSLMSWGEFPRTRHSSKPEEVRAMIERASPGPRIELFGRRITSGWTVWGNQIERTMFDKDIL